MGVKADAEGAEALRTKGYRFVIPVVPVESDYDGQGHLNNAATVRLFSPAQWRHVAARRSVHLAGSSGSPMH